MYEKPNAKMHSTLAYLLLVRAVDCRHRSSLLWFECERHAPVAAEGTRLILARPGVPGASDDSEQVADVEPGRPASTWSTDKQKTNVVAPRTISAPQAAMATELVDLQSDGMSWS